MDAFLGFLARIERKAKEKSFRLFARALSSLHSHALGQTEEHRQDCSIAGHSHRHCMCKQRMLSVMPFGAATTALDVCACLPFNAALFALSPSASPLPDTLALTHSLTHDHRIREANSARVGLRWTKEPCEGSESTEAAEREWTVERESESESE